MSLTMINADLSQAELRTMAILSGDPWMIAALQEGEGDFFVYHLMPVLYPAKFPLGVESVEALKESDPVEFKELRTVTKSVQYGLAFGRQAPAIAKATGLTTRAASDMINNYFEKAPHFAAWRENVMEAAITPAKRDFLLSPTGRRFHSEVVTSKNYLNIQREALSFLPQSISSDICLSAAMRLDQPLAQAGYEIINVVHDAIMIVGEEEGADEVGKVIGETFLEVGKEIMGPAVPYLSDYSFGKSWADLD